MNCKVAGLTSIFCKNTAESPPPPAEEKKKGKENFWFLLPRPQGADEARKLVLTRIVLVKSSDFVQETQVHWEVSSDPDDGSKKHPKAIP